ncbi:hypothetical protein [Streptomyces sp. NPDC003032]
MRCRDSQVLPTVGQGHVRDTVTKYGHHATPETELVSSSVWWRSCEQDRVDICYREEGENGPVGFSTYYHSGDEVLLCWAGFDSDRLAGMQEYFNLLY